MHLSRSIFQSLLPLALALAGSAFETNHKKNLGKRLTHQPYRRSSQDCETRGSEVELVASTWYPGWDSATKFTLDEVKWDRYTHVHYAFLLTNDDPTNFTVAPDDPGKLQDFTKKAHENGVKASASLGGWTGSRYFSSNVGDEKNRTAMAKAIENLIKDNDFDGIDFDWEYPHREGIGCNVINPNDTANFLLLLQELRKNNDFLITAAASLFPWNDASGNQSTDLSGFAEVLDWIELMNYDVWGSWSDFVGPNAPLNDTCAEPAKQQGSAVSAVAKWTAAGIPEHQIVLGVASYGHAFTVNETTAFDGNGDLVPYPPFDKNKRAKGDEWSDPAGTDACGNLSPAGDTWFFRGLVNAGLLNEDGSPADGVPHRFDNCSQTDYLYDKKLGQEVSYDSPQAFAAKGQYIKETGLRGFAMWVSSADPNVVLVDSIREAAGFN